MSIYTLCEYVLLLFVTKCNKDTNCCFLHFVNTHIYHYLH